MVSTTPSPDSSKAKDDKPSYSPKSVTLTEGRAALLAEYRLNGGNISKAAEAVGMNPSYARRIAAQDDGFRMLLKATDEAPMNRIIEWNRLVGKAQETLLELLESPDQRVRFMATREILDRAEGKPTQKTEKTETKVKVSIDQDTMSLALSLLATGKAPSLQEAILKARTEPEKVRAWLDAAPTGREVGEG